MTQHLYDLTEGDKDQKDLLGDKGANLAEMTRLGLPVPDRVHHHQTVCREYPIASGRRPSRAEESHFQWRSTWPGT
jgi:pyruvate,orthophosphate dikinase